jgi:hypothetical protein
MRLPDPDRSRIVLIGSSEYEDAENLPSIPAVRHNVADLHAALTHPEHGIVPLDNCTTLLDEPRLPAVGRALKDATTAAEDLLLVYVAGHGLVGARHELYLAMYESDPENPAFNSLPYDTLRNAVLDSRAQVKVVIVDSCFSGLAIGRTMGDDLAAVVGQLDVAGTYVLTSAERNQVALALPEEQYTAFTGRLLHLLRNGVPGGGEYLTIDTVYSHLVVQMKSEGLSQPQRRAAASAGLVALARNRLFTDTARKNLTQRFNDAVSLTNEGSWGNASTILLDLLDAQTQLFGAADADTMRTVQLLAHAKGATGDPEGAVAMLTDLLDRQAAALGEEHEDTLQTRQLLAVGLAESGRWGEGVDLLRQLLPDRRRVLGPDHGSVYRTVHVLARALAVLGRADEAAALLREAVAGRERLLGPDAAETERTRRDLVFVVQSAGTPEGHHRV